MSDPLSPAGTARVTVVIVNFNGGANVVRCLECLAAQTMPPARIVLVDNASGDGSLAACRNLVTARAELAERTTIDALEANVGFAAGSNRGLALADGEPLAGAAAAGPRFVILDPATPAPDAGPTFGRTSPDAVAIRRELARQIIVADTLVARQCRLEVRFDRGRVAAYRLVGHRQSVVESLAGDEPAEIDLHVGETVRAVYEVVPRDPAGLGLATASVSWRAADGSVIQLDAADRDAADRQAALPSPHGCELLLAATLGELAAGSVHVVQPRGTLSALAAVADRWRARGDLTPFGDALAQEIDRRVPGTRAGRGR
jgi:hypothetical protein